MNERRTAAIPQDWVKGYVDILLTAAGKLPPGVFQDAILVRAEHAMDLVTAWRTSGDRRT